MKYRNYDSGMWKLIERRYKQGRKATPITEKPDLPSELEFYWSSFWRLNATRHFSMAGTPHRLSFTEIESYVRLMGIQRVDSFVDRILMLDVAYVDIICKEQKEKEEKEEAKIKAPRSRNRKRR